MTARAGRSGVAASGRQPTSSAPRRPRGTLGFDVQVVVDDGSSEVIVDEIHVTGNQMRLLLLAVAGFELTREERAEIRETFVDLVGAGGVDAAEQAP